MRNAGDAREYSMRILCVYVRICARIKRVYGHNPEEIIASGYTVVSFAEANRVRCRPRGYASPQMYYCTHKLPHIPVRAGSAWRAQRMLQCTRTLYTFPHFDCNSRSLGKRKEKEGEKSSTCLNQEIPVGLPEC